LWRLECAFRGRENYYRVLKVFVVADRLAEAIRVSVNAVRVLLEAVGVIIEAVRNIIEAVR
jgi:hypothetical protein